MKISRKRSIVVTAVCSAVVFVATCVSSNADASALAEPRGVALELVGELERAGHLFEVTPWGAVPFGTKGSYQSSISVQTPNASFLFRAEAQPDQRDIQQLRSTLIRLNEVPMLRHIDLQHARDLDSRSVLALGMDLDTLVIGGSPGVTSDAWLALLRRSTPYALALTDYDKFSQTELCLIVSALGLRALDIGVNQEALAEESFIEAIAANKALDSFGCTISSLEQLEMLRKFIARSPHVRRLRICTSLDLFGECLTVNAGASRVTDVEIVLGVVRPSAVANEERMIAAVNRGAQVMSGKSADMHTLTRLVIRRLPCLTGSMVVAIGQLPGLRHLEVQCHTVVQGAIFEKLNAAKSLLHVCIDCGPSKLSYEGLERVVQLQSLCVRQVGVSRESTNDLIEKLSRLQKLVSVSLTGHSLIQRAAIDRLIDSCKALERCVLCDVGGWDLFRAEDPKGQVWDNLGKLDLVLLTGKPEPLHWKIELSCGE